MKMKNNYGFRRYIPAVWTFFAFLTVAAVVLIFGVFFLQPGDEMGYALLAFYLLLPLTALVCCLVLGLRTMRIKWFAPVVFAVIGGLVPVAVFKSWSILFPVLILVPSLLGVLIGTAILHVRSKRIITEDI